MIQVTPLYAGLLAFLFMWLSLNVVRGRRLHKISVGDGAEKDMVKRMRTQANFVEYAGTGIMLLLLAELQGLVPWALHLAGLALLAGRVLHAYGFGSTPQIVPLRKWGMYFTLGSICALAAINIVMSVI